MGFLEAISRSGWDGPRQAEAQNLCDQIRESLRRVDFPADPDRVYRNLDSDPLIPDGPAPGNPTSRLEFLDELLRKGPTRTRDELKDAVAQFCRSHKQQGPDDAKAQGRVLGRVCAFKKLEKAFLIGRLGGLRTKNRLQDLIESDTFEKQKAELDATELAGKLMWAFYDPGDAIDPFRSLTRGAANMLDRLGLGEELKHGGKFVKWGHRLPAGLKAHTPTAWDGGADRHWWQPGGRTRPLSVDGGGTKDPSLRPGDGLPEVVHDPVTGRQLATKIAFVTD